MPLIQTDAAITPRSFLAFASSLKVGDEVRLKIFGDGTTREVVLQLPERPG